MDLQLHFAHLGQARERYAIDDVSDRPDHTDGGRSIGDHHGPIAAGIRERNGRAIGEPGGELRSAGRRLVQLSQLGRTSGLSHNGPHQ